MPPQCRRNAANAAMPAMPPWPSHPHATPMNGPTLSHARSHVVRLPRSNLDEIVPCGDGFNFRVQALVDSAGNEMSVPMGDGSKAKPLKCEWSTQKDGKMLIGSTGKERTDDDGKVVHEGEMWIKSFDPKTSPWSTTTGGRSGALRKAAVCPHGAGYMIHEGARCTDVQKWFFCRASCRASRTTRSRTAPSSIWPPWSHWRRLTHALGRWGVGALGRLLCI